jgi:hypothetical protein
MNLHEKTEEESIALLNKIFDAAPSLLASIAPAGWAKSAYVHLLHPTPEQQFEEHKRISENLKKLSKKHGDEKKDKQLSDYKEDDLSDIRESEEFIYVLGLSVWDIFSNNHEAFDSSGVYDLGSFRGSAGFIGDFIDQKFYDNSGKYSYIDFYMGTFVMGERVDLLPIYEFVFRMLKEQKCDWKYHFPRLYLFNFDNENNNQDKEKPEDYNPGTAVLDDIQKKERKEELKKFEVELESSFHGEYEEAKYKPLIPVVQAYKNVFGKLPDGHP